MKKIKIITSFLTCGLCFILSVLILTNQIEINERVMFGMILLLLSILVMKGNDNDE